MFRILLYTLDEMTKQPSYFKLLCLKCKITVFSAPESDYYAGVMPDAPNYAGIMYQPLL